MNIIGLRYFNVFGPRQNPNGDYAAVIPKWINQLINNEVCHIFGTGNQARDFCFVENVIQANINSALSIHTQDQPWIFNIAVGERTSLLTLFEYIKNEFKKNNLDRDFKIDFKDLRKGDVLNSLADIQRARKYINYMPAFDIQTGLNKTVQWYLKSHKKEL